MSRAAKVLLCIYLLAGLIAYAGSQGASAEMLGSSTWPLFAACVVLAFVIQWLAFIPAFLLRTEKFYDLCGGLTYLLLVGICLSLVTDLAPRSILLGGLIAIWASRLSLFLFLRVRRDGFDRRFDKIKVNFWRFFVSWNLQALWIAITAGAALAAMTSSRNPDIDGFAIVGGVLWLLGFAIEAIADEQKRRFRSGPDAQGAFITSGLWAVCRHPNYLGEMLLWIGIALIALPALQGWAHLTLISPLFVYLLLTRVSGINLLEASGQQRWGSDPAYQRYLENTPSLMPRWPIKN